MPHDDRHVVEFLFDCNAQGAWVVSGVEIRAAHTNSRGLVHGGLVAALLDNVMGLACSKALLAREAALYERRYCFARSRISRHGEAGAVADL
jgi:acyl-coenzyme A thioesterase PaaI-like protein